MATRRGTATQRAKLKLPTYPRRDAQTTQFDRRTTVDDYAPEKAMIFPQNLIFWLLKFGNKFLIIFVKYWEVCYFIGEKLVLINETAALGDVFSDFR